MIRILHTACALLLVAVALVAYGVKEEVRALRAERDALLERRLEARAALATAEAEWRHLNAPEELLRAAARLYGPGRLRDADGRVLAPPRPDQAAALDAVTMVR
ncbi:MAG: hypothetical protein AAFW46_05945 [Pseudomonadota bacterium]